MPPGAERREEADEAGSRNSQKKEQKSQFSIPQKSVGHMILAKSCVQRCRGLSPAGRFLRGKQPLKLPHHTMLKIRFCNSPFGIHAVSAYPRCLHDLIGVSDEGSDFGFEIGSIDDFEDVFTCLEFERLSLFLAL